MAEKGIMADNFIGVYPVSKTLRFGLKPIGRTLEYIQRDGILDTDEHRARSYIQVKEIIDEYHRQFIEEVLQNLVLEGLREFAELYTAPRDEKKEKQFKECQDKLRKQIVQAFRNNPKYKSLFKGDLISGQLPEFVKDSPEKLMLVEEFADFTTYFEGFHSNRENMYTEDVKSTAIAYRLIHQNLPRYIDNIKIFSVIQKSEIAAALPELLTELRKKKNINSIEEYFSIEGFSNTLTQSGIDTYNLILGAFSNEDGSKTKGLNEYINLYNQKIDRTTKKIPALTPLYKQILSDREKLSFVPVQFASDGEVLRAVEDAYMFISNEVIYPDQGESLQSLLGNLSAYDSGRIYLANDNSLTDISQQLYSDWATIKNAIRYDYDRKHNAGDKTKNLEKYNEKKEKELKGIPCYSIQFLQEVMEANDTPADIKQFFKEQAEALITQLGQDYEVCKDTLSGEKHLEKPLAKNSKVVSKIKDLLDTMLSLERLTRIFLAGKDEPDKDELFYVELLRLNDNLSEIIPLYNKVRNYVTRKPYSLEKIKLNFNKTTLLSGWDKNKERDNLGIILVKDGLYYLGIMNRKSNKIMEQVPDLKTSDNYQKMEYKQIQDAAKYLSIKQIKPQNPPDEIIEILTKKKESPASLSKKEIHRFIDYCRNDFLPNYTPIQDKNGKIYFNFEFKKTEEYETLNEFFIDVNRQAYAIRFVDVPVNYIEELVETGQLYLFQITGKDFSQYSKGKPNLHTIYWKMLFHPENLKEVVYKLNGQAEVFYRKKSIEESDVICHPANAPLKNKYPKAEKATSTFTYELIKDRRFTADHFEFHVPITMNFKTDGIGSFTFNREVKCCIHDEENMHVIGIDRGERNLLYLTVIDMHGNIKEQMSLNSILSYSKNNMAHEVNYQLLLSTREKENVSARHNWQTIHTIKELKEGYLSQVIHEIAKRMIRYNAIVVFEDLNLGFKRGRQKVERQVYQKFEKMLIEKLNYLVDKEKGITDNGGALRAYQLTAKFESFQKLGKQSGFLFYVPAWNTSKIDPTTGFTNLFYTKYESIEKARTFIANFESIVYNVREGYFEFQFDYSKYTYKAEGSRTAWTVCSYGDRIETFRNVNKNNEWDTKRVDLTKEFCTLFEAQGINWRKGDLRDCLCAVNDAVFYKTFLHIFSLMVQMRDSDAKTGEDKIKSPVQNKYGEFFESSPECLSFPIDADANGAYNIAKKGLWVIEQIKKTDMSSQDKVRLAITNKEWLVYAQEHTL